MKNEITGQDRLNLQKKFQIIDEKQDGWMGYLKLDPTIFAYHFFTNDKGEPFKVHPHQDLILNDDSKRILLNIARQTGKSTAAAIKAIHKSYWRDNTLVLIMSATKPQALEVIRKIKVFLNTSRFTTWKELMPKGKENKAEVQIKNPGTKTYSRIISVPATDAARGYSPNLVIPDELAFWEDGPTIFNQVVLPMVDATDGDIMALSTPNGRHGPHWECYNSKYWSAYHFNWRANPLNTPERMAMKKDTMTDLQFRAEYGAEFVSSRDSYFTFNEIQSSIHTEANQGYKGEGNCCVGVDFGKVNDKCIINIGTILNPDEPKNKQVIRVLDRRVKPLGTDYATIIAELKAINNEIRPSRFILDSTGVGEGPSDVLTADGLPVDAFKFSLFSKVTIMNNLKILMQQKRIQIPNEMELINQLEMFEYIASKSGGVAQPKLHAPEGCHDDEVDSLALLAYGLTKGLGYVYSSFVSDAEHRADPDPTISKGIQSNEQFLRYIRENSTGIRDL